jgi:Protein of unknown function (DUF3606)
MTQSASLDKIEAVAQAIELFAELKDVAARSDDALVAACALAELLEPNTIVGYTTIDDRRPVATFQTAVYPRLPSWPFSKAHDVPITRPYVGTCAQAICEGRIITCSNIATEINFNPTWRAACIQFGLRSVQSAPVFGFDGRPLGTFVTASHQSRHSFNRYMTGFGVYALRTILQKQLQFPVSLSAPKPMAEKFKNLGAPDSSRISMNDEHQVRHWTETLGCSKGELAAAVARVGNSSDAVRREVYRHWAYGTVRRDAPKPRRRGRPRKRA